MAENNQNQTPEEEFQSFRNSIGTAEKSGKRKWVYAKNPRGNTINGEAL